MDTLFQTISPFTAQFWVFEQGGTFFLIIGAFWSILFQLWILKSSNLSIYVKTTIRLHAPVKIKAIKESEKHHKQWKVLFVPCGWFFSSSCVYKAGSIWTVDGHVRIMDIHVEKLFNTRSTCDGVTQWQVLSANRSMQKRSICSYVPLCVARVNRLEWFTPYGWVMERMKGF